MKKNIFLSVLFLIALLLNATNLYAGSLDVAIQLDKEIFGVDEPISGDVIITSTVPSTYRTTFKMILYRNDRLYRQFSVYMPVFMGQTKFKLDDFGLKSFNQRPHVPGRWAIIIKSTSRFSVKTEARFIIKNAQ